MPSYPKNLAEAQEKARRIAMTFGNLQCTACAVQLAQALGPDVDAYALKLRTTGESDIIGLISRELRISLSGFHVAIRLGELVFDNLHHDGIAAELWAKKFTAGDDMLLTESSLPVRAFFGKRFKRRAFLQFTSSRKQTI
jgi:hypothetical protein